VRDITNELVELVRLTSTDLPKSIQDALINARQAEDKGSAAEAAMVSILENVEMSRRNQTPICQGHPPVLCQIWARLGTRRAQNPNPGSHRGSDQTLLFAAKRSGFPAREEHQQ